MFATLLKVILTILCAVKPRTGSYQVVNAKRKCMRPHNFRLVSCRLSMRAAHLTLTFIRLITKCEIVEINLHATMHD